MKMIKNKKKKDVMITWKKMKGAFVNKIKKPSNFRKRIQLCCIKITKVYKIQF